MRKIKTNDGKTYDLCDGPTIVAIMVMIALLFIGFTAGWIFQEFFYNKEKCEESIENV